MNAFVRLCLCAALAGLVAPSALADEGLYLRLAAGGGHVDEDSYGNFDFELGYVGSAAIGYNWFFPENFADFRVELEGSYRYNDVDELVGVSSDGETQAFSLMINGFFDIRTNLVVVPYFGAGFGATQIRHEDDGAGGVFVTIDDHDTVFAYQMMAGLTYDLGDNLAVGIEYRFLETEEFELSTSAGSTLRDEYDHHSALVTLTLGF